LYHLFSSWTVTYGALKIPFHFYTKWKKSSTKYLKIAGYLQSFIHFSNIIQTVKHKFTFKDDISGEAAYMLKEVRDKNKPSLIVGIHARRGDFLEKQYLGYIVPKKSYFTKAIDWIKFKFHNETIIFVVASDDVDWCTENLSQSDVSVLPPASPGVHLAVLSTCDHMIISGGSFGWWGGWLSGGTVIYYSEFMRKGTRLGDRLKRDLYYPPHWMGMND
jgi:galactoside 2-L-fucosyltransferase 1/2